MDRAAELAGWDDRHALRDGRQPDGRVRGLGAACQIWWGGGGPPAHALVRLGADGVATVVTGTQDIGTGTTTVLAQVAAEELGLPLDRVRVETGTTRYGVFAPVSGGSQTAPRSRPAVRAAANDVRGRCSTWPRTCSRSTPTTSMLVDGEIRSRDGGLREPLTEVTGKLGSAQLVGTGSRGPNPEGMRVHTFGCQIAQVAIDTATGEIEVERIVAVHDVGRVLNPLTRVEPGRGRRSCRRSAFALMEERVIDPTTGTVRERRLRGLQADDDRGLPRDHRSSFVDRARPEPLDDRRQGARRAADHPDRGARSRTPSRRATGVRMREAPLTRRRVLEVLP